MGGSVGRACARVKLWGGKARKLNESVLSRDYNYTPLGADGMPCKQQLIPLHWLNGSSRSERHQYDVSDKVTVEAAS